MCHYTLGNINQSKTYANVSAALINQYLPTVRTVYLYQLMTNNR